MKTYVRIIIFLVVAAILTLAFYAARQATEPQSGIIARERERFSTSRDRDRMKSDPIYAAEVREKKSFLDYRLAVAYNTENKPDKAIEILKRLISEEEATGQNGIPRRSRSYMKEADYFEALKEAYELKNEPSEVNRALDRYAQLRTKAAALRRLESSEDGRHVGRPAD